MKTAKKDSNTNNLIFYQEIKDLNLIVKIQYFLNHNKHEIDKNKKEIIKILNKL